MRADKMRKGRAFSPLGHTEVTDAKLQQKKDKHLSCLQQLNDGKITAIEDWTALSPWLNAASLFVLFFLNT